MTIHHQGTATQRRTLPRLLWIPVSVSFSALCLSLEGSLPTWILVSAVIVAWAWMTMANAMSDAKHTGPSETQSRLARSAEELDRLITTELNGLQKQTEQVRKIVSDAVAQLQESFQSMSEHTRAHADITSSMTKILSEGIGGSSEGQVTIRGFAQETDGLLHHFVETVENVSQESMKISTNIAHVTTAMEEVTSLVNEIRSLGHQTRILSLNATIEASRAGKAGAGFGVVAAEVRSLSKSTSLASSKITTAVHRALERMQEMKQASGDINNTASKDLDTALESKDRLGCMVDGVQGLENTISSRMDEVEQIGSAIGTSISGAVRALQFDDITSQLLESLGARLDTLRELSATLKQASSEASTQNEREERIANVLLGYAEIASDSADKRVGQESVEAGSTELF